MSTKLNQLNKTQSTQKVPDIRAGDIVRVHSKLAEKTKAGGQRIQIFEGLIIARKHGKEPGGTFTVRKISNGMGIERIFPIFCPTIAKIEIVKRSKVRRAKLYYMRERQGKKARMKTKELFGVEWSPAQKEILKSSEESSGSVKVEAKEETILKKVRVQLKLKRKKKL